MKYYDICTCVQLNTGRLSIRYTTAWQVFKSLFIEGNDGMTELLEVSEEVVQKWQSIVNIMAKIIDIPAALIMRIDGHDIEVFVSSQSKGNPYQRGDREHLIGSGIYCEAVVKSKKKLLIPNALIDNEWKDNPDIKLHIISYLGFPILMPSGKVFGTICVLDNKENSYSPTYEELILQLKELIESHLSLLQMNKTLEDTNKQLNDFLGEIKTLRGILPICAQCKKVRNDEGYWNQIERYIEQHSNASFSHAICPECAEKLYGNENWYNKKDFNKE
jgi:transcriptional regulator with GAF, ATPase, and Fis domain